MHDQSLAACGVEQVAAILERIRSDYLSTQVFFELGREASPFPEAAADLYHLSAVVIARHARLNNLSVLGTCLETIGKAFQEVSGETNHPFFALDDRGGIYVHRVTHASIARLWQQLVLGSLGQAPAPERSGLGRMHPNAMRPAAE